MVERKHQHLLNITRALLFQANLPKLFWSFAVSHAAFIINRITSPVLDNHTPYELLHNKPPDLSMLRVFGSLCFASTLTHNRSKLDSRARKCISLGHKPGTKGYILFDLQSRETFVSRHVIFHEHNFPFHYIHHNLDHEPVSHNTQIIPLPEQNSITPTDYTPPPTTTPIANPTCAPQNQLPTRQSSRIRRVPSYLQDFHYNLPSSAATQSSERQINSVVRYPLSSVLSYNSLSPHYKSFILNISSTTEPKSYSQAVKHECWQQAMKTEIDALERNHTWTLVDLPPGKTPIGCK